MRVGIDGRTFSDPGNRGVARYTRRLIAALAKRFPEDELRVLVPGGAPLSLEGLDAPNVAITRRRLRRIPHAAAALAGRPRLDRQLGGGLDVVWGPAPAPLAVSAGIPFVLTLHDLSWELRPHDFTRYERLFHSLARPRRLAARAARVICVSQAVAADAADRWGLDQAQVVPPGVDPPRSPTSEAIAATRARYELDQRYLLFVGALEPRKAPDVLAAAYARARNDGLDADLAYAGTGRLASELAGPGIHLLGRVPEEDLTPLYAGALALVAPSWIEGFGLPPLEAALCETPAVVTDLPSFVATLGGAALRVPPGDEQALAEALVRMAGDEQLCRRLGAEARAAAAGFTWERAAGATRAVLVDAAAR